MYIVFPDITYKRKPLVWFMADNQASCLWVCEGASEHLDPREVIIELKQLEYDGIICTPVTLYINDVNAVCSRFAMRELVFSAVPEERSSVMFTLEASSMSTEEHLSHIQTDSCVVPRLPPDSHVVPRLPLSGVTFMPGDDADNNISPGSKSSGRKSPGSTSPKEKISPSSRDDTGSNKSPRTSPRKAMRALVNKFRPASTNILRHESSSRLKSSLSGETSKSNLDPNLSPRSGASSVLSPRGTPFNSSSGPTFSSSSGPVFSSSSGPVFSSSSGPVFSSSYGPVSSSSSSPVSSSSSSPVSSSSSGPVSSSSSGLSYTSIAFDELIVDNGQPGFDMTLWRQTKAQQTCFAKVIEQEAANKPEKFLKNGISFFKQQQYINSNRLYIARQQFISCFKILFDELLNPLYEHWILRNNPELMVRKQVYSYFQQSVAEAMSVNRLCTQPTEFESMTEEEREQKFKGNQQLFTDINREAWLIRAKPQLRKLMVLINNNDRSFDILATNGVQESDEVLAALQWFKVALGERYLTWVRKQLKYRIRDLLNIEIQSGETEFENVKAMAPIHEFFEKKEPVFGEYTSFIYLLNQQLIEKRVTLKDRTRRILSDSSTQSAEALSPEILTNILSIAKKTTVCVINFLNKKYADKPPLEYMSKFNGGDTDFYVADAWKDRLVKDILCKEKFKLFLDDPSNEENQRELISGVAKRATHNITKLYADSVKHDRRSRPLSSKATQQLSNSSDYSMPSP